jgi:hypothetical protein
MAKLFERKGNMLIIDRVDTHAFDGICAFCGELRELRPVGSLNENICFDCGMKDRETTYRKLKELMNHQ